MIDTEPGWEDIDWVDADLMTRGMKVIGTIVLSPLIITIYACVVIGWLATQVQRLAQLARRLE